MSKLVCAVRELDESILTAERVSQLLKLCPSEEEELMLLSYVFCLFFCFVLFCFVLFIVFFLVTKAILTILERSKDSFWSF